MKTPKRKTPTRKQSVLQRCLVRLQEPSTYASLAALSALAGLQIEPGIVQNITMAGAALAGIAGVALPEGSAK